LIIGILARIVANPTALDAMAKNAGAQNWVLWLIMQGIAFAAGTTTLIFGLRMFLAALVPAFKGISEKLIPGAIPALDCAAFYPFSPMGAALGFIGNAIAGILVAIVLLITRNPLLVYPSLAISFFDGALEGVFGNKLGGWKAAIVSGFIGGLILHVGVLLLNPLTGPLATSGIQYGNVDTSSFNAILFTLIRAIGRLFGVAA
jgi:PTS system ascorbate-specific IIC component